MVNQILLVHRRAMNEMYGSSEFFDNLNRQDLLELGLSAQNEGEDYFTSLLQRGEELKRLEKQLKKQGDDPHAELKSDPNEAVNGVNAGAFTRRHTLLPEHATIKKVTKKGNTDRLHKAMGLK
jgi:hypothetical protein